MPSFGNCSAEVIIVFVQLNALLKGTLSMECTDVIVIVPCTNFPACFRHATWTAFPHINQEIPLYQFPRVDPDRDAPCTHLKDPCRCLHARVKAVFADRGGQAGLALHWGGDPVQPPPALP